LTPSSVRFDGALGVHQPFDNFPAYQMLLHDLPAEALA